MVRRYAAAVDVVRRDEVPAELRWRGQQYTVEHVLEVWRESAAWWESADVRSLQTGDTGAARPGGLTTTVLPPSPRWGQAAWGEPAPEVGVAVPGGLGVLADDREVWRLEIAPVRGGSPADLTARPARPGPAPIGAAARGVVVELVHVPAEARWLLVRVHD